MKLRRIIAVWAAKLAEKISVYIFHKQGVTWAGKIALKICPDVLTDLAAQVKKDIFMVCGTNGKTTTNNTLCAALEAEGYRFASAQVENVPQTTVTLTSEDDIKNMNKLVDALEEDDDVQDIYHNWEENE